MPRKTNEKVHGKTKKGPPGAREPSQKPEIGEPNVPELPDDGGSRRDVPEVGQRPPSTDDDDPRRREGGHDIDRDDPDGVVGGEDVERGPSQ